MLTANELEDIEQEYLHGGRIYRDENGEERDPTEEDRWEEDDEIVGRGADHAE